MSSLDNIYEKMAPANEPTSSPLLPPVPPVDNRERRIGREVAHELNNVFTIIRGYADRLLLKHGANASLRPELQLIADNARRAEKVVRAASMVDRH